MPGKKKGVKKGKKGKSGSKSKNKDKTKRDAIHQPVESVRPPLFHGEKLLELLKTKKVDEKELHGFKVSTKALEQLSPQDVRDLRVVFEAFDINSDGLIGPTELRKAMRGLGFKASREEIKRMIGDVSATGSSLIEFNEFLDLVIQEQGEARDFHDEILQGFKMFDYENQGKLSIENLKEASKEAGVKFSQQDLEDMMEEADLNGDGYVDKDEFIKIMLQTNLF